MYATGVVVSVSPSEFACWENQAKGFSGALPAVRLVNYGVLGKGKVSDKEEQMGEVPNSSIVFVDVACLDHLRPPGGPKDASGAAGEIYEFLSINKDESFPREVTDEQTGITKEAQAKFHKYGCQPCIHTVGPDFRAPDQRQARASKEVYTEESAVGLLTAAYLNVLLEFCNQATDTETFRTLRLLPISGGIFSGEFRTQLPVFTARALKGALERLEPDQSRLLQSLSPGLEMCIYMDTEMAQYQQAFLRLGM